MDSGINNFLNVLKVSGYVNEIIKNVKDTKDEFVINAISNKYYPSATKQKEVLVPVSFLDDVRGVMDHIKEYLKH